MQLTVEKLCKDIDEIVEDDAIFSHLIDETLAFEQEIRESLGYPSSYCSAITVLTQAKYLTKWLAIEEQCKSVTPLEYFISAQCPQIGIYLFIHSIFFSSYGRQIR